MAKMTLTEYRENLQSKSVSQSVKLAFTLGQSMRVSAFKVAMICDHCTDKSVKGAITQSEFAYQAEISKGTLSDIMKAYRLIVAEGDDTMELFLNGSVQFKYNVISRYADKVDIHLVELCNMTQKQVAELVESGNVLKSSDPKKGNSDPKKGSKGDSVTFTSGNTTVLVTDEHGNKYLVPAEILAQYAQ